MSRAVYQEPYKVRAAMLAVLVHGAFFALLYFGFAWQSQPGEVISVDLWQGIPGEVSGAPAGQGAQKVEEAAPPPQQEATVKPEIALPEEKKKQQQAEPKPLPRIRDVIQPKTEDVKIRGKIGNISGMPVSGGTASRQAATGTGGQGGKAAAVAGSVVDQYKAMIHDKIHSNVVQPLSVTPDLRVVFRVTVLPGGSVLPPQLTKSSGNSAYDDAVERAILKSQPLPLPPDPALFGRFRELELVFRPEPKN
ncbi:MAG TPA: cell envelope integrity protein TolA [Gallionella sp.]|nr:cell envelope integrity protein TolA [Gallionella sp.]